MRMRMLRCWGALVFISCAGCAYQNPAQSIAPTSIDPSAPSQVTVGASPGSGADGGTAIVTARVQNANGVALANVVVTFTTTRGTVSPTQATTGGNGAATAKLTASDTADVTAAVGTISAHTLVVVSPPDTSTPTPTLALSFLNVSGSATTGVPLPFGVSSSATGVTWIWSFGDGAGEQGSAFTTTHTYTRAGTYTASVSSASTTTSSAPITVTDPPVQSPTPGNALVAVLTCTPGTHGASGAATVCNVSLTYGGNPVGGGTVTRVEWDWGDGTTFDNLTAVPVKTHLYVNPGTYNVFATVTATPIDVPITVRTSKAVVVP
jgi:PKD domain/Bacterial Ig-like domain (group 1)